MADIGAIGSEVGNRSMCQVFTTGTVSVIRARDDRVADAAHMAAAALRRSVSGTIKQDTTLVSREVGVFNRATKELLRETVSAVDGTWSLDVGPFAGEVFIAGFDDIGVAPDYNADISDLVIPG